MCSTMGLTHQDVYKLDSVSHHYQYSVFVVTIIVIFFMYLSYGTYVLIWYENHESCLISLSLIKVQKGPIDPFGSVDYTF